MKYALLIYTEEVDPSTMDPAEGEKVMGEYAAFTQSIAERGIMKAGEALHPTDSATTVRVRNGETVTTDGPFAETKEAMGGFYIVDVADLDAAIAVAAELPGSWYGTVEIRPVWEWETDYAG
jgi:hypothetical protein